MDSFNPGQRIPSLQLRAKPVQKENEYIPELSYLINLQGAREPNNFMLIEIEPFHEQVATTEGIVTFVYDSSLLKESRVSPDYHKLSTDALFLKINV